MPHNISLITTVAAGLGLALVFGFLAARLKLPALVGYLAAGIAIGPATPGFVADVDIASQLAEIGVMLLMFGVGLHFSLEGPARGAASIAVPGALVTDASVATDRSRIAGLRPLVRSGRSNRRRRARAWRWPSPVRSC